MRPRLVMPYESARDIVRAELQAVIIDIDGTLADCNHRLHHAHEQNWSKFFAAEAMIEDKPLENMIHLCNTLTRELNVYLVTGRPERTRLTTERWLITHCCAYDELYMRKDGDFRPDHIIKSEILDEIGPHKVVCAFEDRRRVVEMWRSRGILCCQVSDGNY